MLHTLYSGLIDIVFCYVVFGSTTEGKTYWDFQYDFYLWCSVHHDKARALVPNASKHIVEVKVTLKIPVCLALHSTAKYTIRSLYRVCNMFCQPTPKNSQTWGSKSSQGADKKTGGRCALWTPNANQMSLFSRKLVENWARESWSCENKL